jgi:hypothetical protein
MPDEVSPDESLRRLLRYATATAVRFEGVPRHAGWDGYGLPDLRGFAPQRRVVRRFHGEPAEFPRKEAIAAGRAGFADLTPGELWLLHDLAHVAWYDVATLTFGAARWLDEPFFLEQHLASEAFAVLLLDYQLLSRTPHRGLAVELDAADWGRLRRRVAALPELRSLAMAQALVGHYFGQSVPLFRAPLRGAPLRARGDDVARLSRWREHEVSYADKQRWYVRRWWDDLAGRRPVDERVVVDDPTLAELVWLTARRFTADPEPAFAAWLASVGPRLRGVRDVFRGLPKMQGAQRVAVARAAMPDFRFTDVAAFGERALARWVDAAVEPSAAALFLFWQLLGRVAPSRLAATDRRAVARLAASTQTTAPDRAAWARVREICRTIVGGAARRRSRARPAWQAAFFLP